MLQTAWLVALVLSASWMDEAKPTPPEPLEGLFEARLVRGDTEGIEELFRARSYEVIHLVDGYLEAWLAEMEKPMPERIPDVSALLRTAREAALRGDRALGTDVYSRYAKAWEEWTSEERLQFRAGQRHFRAGREAQKKRELETAVAEYTRSLEIAKPLGDLWGIGHAEQRLGDLAFGAVDLGKAVEHHTRALEMLGSMRHSGLLRSCRALAAIHEREGRLDEAVKMLERMIATADEMGLADDEATEPVRADLRRLREKVEEHDKEHQE